MSADAAFVVVIPARYASSRFPGKPLALLAGKPMLRWAFEHAQQSGASAVIVATDDERIATATRQFGGDVCMTDPAHQSGTDRIAEVCRARGLPGDAIVVNLQGDEPGVPPALLRQVADALAAHPEAGIATLATPITTAAALFDPNVVKTVLDAAGIALTFSRAPLPWVRDAFAGLAPGAVPGTLPADVPFLRHLGIYAYRVDTLAAVSAALPHPVERAESLEQLRALCMGVRIHVGVVEEPPGHGVDTPDDLAAATAYLEAR